MSDKLQVSGKLIVLNETQTFPSGFSKREFVIETPGDYPQAIKLEAVKDKCAALDSIPLGSILAVDFDIRGNEYKGKYYVNLQSWKVEVTERGSGAPEPKPEERRTSAGGPVSDNSDFKDDDDIPF